jgi:coniferyl-aldehyde dehydrogenase
MRAAAENLTPVTLELGGKSPTLVTDHFSIKVAAERIIFGKLCNAGQTCIAPDYVLVPKQKVTEFIKFAQEATASMYPTLENNPDYTSIINNRQKTRLQSYVDEASVDPTNKVIPLHTEALPPSSRKLTPSIVMGSSELKVFADEIFGPILPIVPYDTLDEAISYINARPKPLALYAFSDNQSEIDQILNNTISGGVTINDIFHHLLSNNLPFGGVGPSGMGHYHGKSGFDTFSKQKGVFKQSRFNAGKMLYPPYTKLHERVMRFIIG